MPTAPRKPTQEMNIFSRQRKPERRKTQEHRDRPRDEHQHERHHERGPRAYRAVGCGQTSRPSSTNIDDLRQPGDGVEEDNDGVVRAGRPVADHQPAR